MQARFLLTLQDFGRVGLAEADEVQRIARHQVRVLFLPATGVSDGRNPLLGRKACVMAAFATGLQVVLELAPVG